MNLSRVIEEKERLSGCLFLIIVRHQRFTGSWRSVPLGSPMKTARPSCPLALPLKLKRRTELGPTLWELASFSSEFSISFFGYVQELCKFCCFWGTCEIYGSGRIVCKFGRTVVGLTACNVMFHITPDH